MNAFRCAVTVLLLAVPLMQAGEIGFLEDFALARDRTMPLGQLIPGTEDHYYYTALHHLNTGQYDRAAALTAPWLSRFGQTQRLTEIQTRHALLTYDRDPQKTLNYLRSRLGIRCDHQKLVPGAVPQLPTVLDPKLISRETLRASSFARWQNLDNFEDVALDGLARLALTPERRRHLLQRLTRPDIAQLPRLVADDLKALQPVDFGAYPIHAQMTLAQLEELLTLRPDLLNHQALVRAYLVRLRPGADEDWKRDRTLTRGYLERLQTFTDRLDPVHNPLKAHILYHRLALDRAQGVYDPARFLAYLKLPRQQPYMARTLLEKPESRQFPADLNADYAPLTLLPPVGSDEPLVRSYLAHFFAGTATARDYEAYVDDTYLKYLYAETRIVLGLGDPEAWAAQLPPELYRDLRERVDIDFSPTNKIDFATDERVVLDLFLKNTPSLLIKVFEVNTLGVYRRTLREIDTDINLDGLVANTERTEATPEPPLRRVPRRLEFPELNKPGVYVIDFIGSGKSSRALIRKGRLRPLVRTGQAGQVVTVVDEADRLVKDAALWLGGQEYRADAEGQIVVPFSTNPGSRPVVLNRGEFASLDQLLHPSENYALRAGIHIEREALLTQRVASVMIRPGLFLNGHPVSLQPLEDVRLRITSTDHSGIATTLDVPNFKIFEDRESVHEIRVPARLATLAVSLMARLKILSQGKTVELAASETFTLNGIERSEKIEDLHLARFGSDYVLELLGRTGEARADRPVTLALKHREFREPVPVVLKSDPRGRIHLGSLTDIDRLTATGPEGTAHTWNLPEDRHTYRQLLHVRAGEILSLPFSGTIPATREELALFEMRGSEIKVDRFEALAVREGVLEVRGLAAGDYDLWMKRTGERVRIRVVDGVVQAGYVLGKVRHLQLPGLKPVQISDLRADAENVTVRLRDASPFTRVHVVATRYLPAFSPFANLGRIRDAELGGVYPGHADSAYLTGRNIGDEYRYVLDRRSQRKFPGVMVERPALLLNPWAVRSTETLEQLAAEGGTFGRTGAATPPAPAAPAPPKSERGAVAEATGFANLDFLGTPAAVVLNRVPDKEGVIQIPRKEIGPHALVQVVVIDPLYTTVRSLALPEPTTEFVDLRLLRGLDPSGHFAQQKEVSLLTAGKPFTLAEIASSRMEVYDSLARVHALYATLSKDTKLSEFSFILRWPGLKPEEKRTLYSKYACHELSFFLYKKDPDFFKEVIRPYLANKKDKTFMDRWLLEENLRAYLSPWEYGRLNSVERVLLGQRLEGESAKTARHLSDLQRLQPPRLDRTLLLFDTALRSSSLSRDEALGLEKAKSDLAPQRRLEERLGEGKDAKAEERKPADEPTSAAGAVPMEGAPGAGRLGAETKKDTNFRGGGGFGGRDGRTLGKGGEAGEKQSDKEMKHADRFFAEDLSRKRVERQLYRRLDPTMEWAENNYYHLRIHQQLADLVPVSPFWVDYAQHTGKGPFLSRHLADASRNFTEMMLALAVLDLPMESGKHAVAFQGGTMTLTPANAALAFHEEVRPSVAQGAATPLMITQNFYRLGERYREENGERMDRFVTDEFVVHTVYGGQVVVTNPTSSRQKLSLLVQVPVGSIPVANGQFTRSVPLDLEPYRTQTLDYLFYFPLPGKFAQFPAHLSREGKFLAAATATTFSVVARPSRLDTTSWDYVSQNGTNEEVLAFLARENVQALDLTKVAFRMKERPFFEAVLTLLRERHVYQPVLWSYALLHGDVPAAQQYLLHADSLVAEAGGPLTSPLLTIDPVARHLYEHLEYRPLVNARAHTLGQRRQIVNPGLLEQYQRFLKTLTYHRDLDDTNLLALTHYLLVQDRVAEALETFSRIQPDKVPTRIQYDYCAAYLDLCAEKPVRAREIVQRYRSHPVDRWRDAFVALRTQLDEIEGKGPVVVNPEDRGQQQGLAAATEPNFEAVLEGRAVNLSWQHLPAVRINYYLMDVEFLFSRNPFVQQSAGQFASIRPNATRDVRLPADLTAMAVPLPEDLARQNVLIEVIAAGKTRSIPYYANTMTVTVTENYGQLRVSDAVGGTPLGKVYVKVYARLADGRVKFHKDGYTDLRGRFDYASVSTPEPQPIEKFSILVLSEERGALIREATAPQR